MVFTAEYSGTCEDCGQELKGMQVTYVGQGNLVHIRCPRVEVCQKCFLTKPCDCE